MASSSGIGVSNIFYLFLNSTDNLNDFLLTLNSHNPDLKFTLELGKDTINFLDLTLTFLKSLDKFHIKFDIYRKPTFTGSTIPGNSFHASSQIHAAYHNMIHGLINILLGKGNFNKKVSTISQNSISQNSTSSDCVMQKGTSTSERNCSTIEHNWSTIDSRCFEPKIRNGGLSSKNHPLVIENRGGYNKLQHNWAQLIPVVSNPKFGMGG